jgi:hyaluronoglucosaminidase
VYVNGAEEAQGTLGANPLSNDATTKIGCRNSTGDQAFDGTIDDVRIYDRALNAEEIQQLYEEGGS